MSSPAPVAAPKRFSRFEFLVAGRYLRSRRKDGFISVIAALTLAGIAIGVATLIVVTSVMSGFRVELTSKILGLNGHFSAYPIEQRFTDYPATVAEIESIDGVTRALALVEGEALAAGPAGASSAVALRGIELQSIEKLDLLADGIRAGGWSGWDDGRGVAIGWRLAERLGLQLGDPVTLLKPGADAQGGGSANVRSFPVTAIFDLGMVEFDSFFIYMPMAGAQAYLGLPEQVTTIEIFVSNPLAIEPMRASLEQGIGRPLILNDWRQRNQSFFEALQIQETVLFVILSAIILVAAFNIVSSLVMLVKDKSKDIAVLRTMGATRGAIMRIFSMTGMAIGVAGTLLGTLAGLVLAANAEALRAFISSTLGVTIFPPELFYLSSLPSRIGLVDVALVVAVAIALSFLATLYPAWRAAHYDPVEALRYE